MSIICTLKGREVRCPLSWGKKPFTDTGVVEAGLVFVQFVHYKGYR